MQFTTSFVSLLAAVSAVAAIPWGSAATPKAALAPVPVTALNCDGDTFKCTANLKFGDGRTVAQWSVSVFQNGLFGAERAHLARSSPQFQTRPSEMSMAPVPVSTLNCDGATYTCTAGLKFGDGSWVAQWPTAVFHTGAFGGRVDHSIETMAPVPVTALNCDGDTFTCTANLQFGDGRTVAQWKTAVFHTSGFLDQD